MSTAEERITALETDNHNIHCRINEVQNDVRVLRDLVASVRELTVTMNTIKEGQDDIRSRLECIERAPGEDARYYRRIVVGTILGAIAGAIVTAIITLL